MEISETRSAEVVVIALKGRLDASTAPQLEEKMTSLLESRHSRLLLDFAALSYISSAGLRVLLMTAKRLQELGGKLALCALQHNLRQIFDIAGFTAIFSIYPTPEEALKELQ